MDKIIIIPFLISAVLLFSRKPNEVFILVFLPTLTLIPVYFETELVPGTPELYFWSAALVPILAVWSLRGFEGYKYHWMDMIILLYLFIIFYGQLVNSDYKKAQKVIFNNLMAIYFPYIMVRAFCTDRNVMSNMIKMMTLLGAFVAIFNMYEFRIFTNVFDKYLRQTWPHYVMWDTGMVMIRSGFKRSLGPFSHPIVAGYYFSMMAPLSIWCHYYNPYIFKKKNIGRFVIFLNIMGLIVSISRAPIIGFVLGMLIICYGWSRYKVIIMIAVSVMLGIVLMISVPKFIKYASTTRENAETVEQRNVAYRKEMWKTYIKVVIKRPYTGWGRFTIPTVKGMDSIDSEYLGVALASGIIALSLYLIFLLGMFARLIRFASKKSYDDPWGRLVWCILAGWISAIFSQGTVYSGAQTVQYLYMLGGIGQILILTSVREGSLQIGHDFSFKRVI